MQNQLKDRLRLAMEGPPRVSQAELARVCKVAPPSVNDWLSGKSKSMEASKLLAAARLLQVSPDWLATGRGPIHPQREINVKDQGDEMRSASHFPEWNPVIWAEAEKWIRFEERAGVVFQPVRRAERLMEIYRDVLADGGSLTPEHAEAFIRAVRSQREKEEGNGTARGGP
jgi:transcriptional regulator with XRE-family HTH domain